MLDKNSSSGAADSSPDHLDMSDIRDRSLWIGGIPIAKRSLNRAISALLSSNSMRSLSDILEV